MARKTRDEGGYAGLPLSMTERARPSPSLGRKVKENRTPKTKEERAGGKNPTDEEKLQARFLEQDRKKFEKRTQEKMGSFKKGGKVRKIDGIAQRGKTKGRMI
jgi:hypothetical protein